MQEIERKFLVAGPFRQHATRATHVVQGYLSSGDGATVRIRIAGVAGYITVKGPTVGLTRYEWEKEIPLEEARQLLRLCAPGRIEKTRYLVPHGGHTFEVDEFHGENEGLVVAELELDSEDEPFERPDWLGEEVTADRRYRNAALSRRPFSQW